MPARISDLSPAAGNFQFGQRLRARQSGARCGAVRGIGAGFTFSRHAGERIERPVWTISENRTREESEYRQTSHRYGVDGESIGRAVLHGNETYIRRGKSWPGELCASHR